MIVEDLGGHRWVFTLIGEWDLSTRPGLRERLGAVTDPGTRVVVDLSRADFIDATVLAALLTGSRRPRTAGAEHAFAVVARPGTVPARVLGLVRATSVMSVFASRAEAERGAFGDPAQAGRTRGSSQA